MVRGILFGALAATSLLIACGSPPPPPRPAAEVANAAATSCHDVAQRGGYYFIAGDSKAQALPQSTVALATWFEGKPLFMPECHARDTAYAPASNRRRCSSRVVGAGSLEAFVPGIAARIGAGVAASEGLDFSLDADYLYTASRPVVRDEIEGPAYCRTGAQFFVQSFYWGNYLAARADTQRGEATYGLVNGSASASSEIVDQGTGPLMVALQPIQEETICRAGSIADPNAPDRCIEDPSLRRFALGLTLRTKDCRDAFSKCDVSLRVDPPGYEYGGPRNTTEVRYDIPWQFTAAQLLAGVRVSAWDTDDISNNDSIGSCVLRVSNAQLRVATGAQPVTEHTDCGAGFDVDWSVNVLQQ